MTSLIEAIEKKYNAENFEDHGPEDGSFVILVPKNSLPSISGTNCGWKNLVLNRYDISHAGEDSDKLKDLCKNVEDLDLSHNSLTSWSEILKILEHSPMLHSLNLSFNDLSVNEFPEEEDSSITVPPNLKTFALVGTAIKWPSLWKALKHISSLTEVHLSLNGITHVDLPSKDSSNGYKFEEIEKVMLEGNQIADWAEIDKLGQVFPSLKHLSLSKCPLRIAGEFNDSFPNLETINLSATLIQDADEVMALNQLPKLVELRLSGVPFLSSVPEKERRQEFIALLPKITKLNGGMKISDDERVDAERFYIRKYMDVDGDRSKRYYELVEKHGKLKPLAKIDLKPVTKLKLKIKVEDQEFEEVVNVKQTVREFKKSLTPLIGLPPSRFNVYLIDEDICFGREILRFPDKQLYTYHMHEGNQIIVERKNNTSREIDT